MECLEPEMAAEKNEIMSIDSFVYKWTFLPTLDWYVGVHKGTEDDGYTCSSSIVKDMIEWCPELWERTIVDVGSYDEMYELESAILQTSDAKRDIRSFNQHNNNGRFHRVGISPPNKGIVGVVKDSDSTKLKKSLVHKGKPKTSEHVAKVKAAVKAGGKLKGRVAPNKGVPMSEESKAKMRSTKTGMASGKKGKKYPGIRPQSAIDAVKAKVTGMTMKHKGKPWTQARRDAQNKRKLLNTHLEITPKI